MDHESNIDRIFRQSQEQSDAAFEKIGREFVEGVEKDIDRLFKRVFIFLGSIVAVCVVLLVALKLCP